MMAAADNLTFVPLVGEGEFEQIIAVLKMDNQSPALRQFIERI